MKLPASFITYLESKTVLVSGLALFFVALVILLPGIWEVTGISGKDEYFLSLRTPLTMMEMDQWWVPWLDDAPRLKKPPMIYWLSRLSMEMFGPSLFSARLVAVLLAALFIFLVFRIGESLVDRRYGILAALITLSTMSLAVESRRLMLDLPAAVFSTLAFYLILGCWQQPRLGLVITSAVALAAAVLTKGPLGLAVFGAGTLAVFIVDSDKRGLVLKYYWHALVFIIVLCALVLPWFIHVYTTYPDVSISMMQEDVKSRQLLTFSGAPFSALLLLLFPWSFILVWVLFKIKSILAVDHPQRETFILLLVWLTISLLPFLFFRSFTRYMAGSIVPMALICAAIPGLIEIHKLKLASRIAMLLSIAIATPILFFIFWFNHAWLVAALGMVVLGYFCVHWWQSRHQEKMIYSSALLWLALLGIAYPAMGINSLPEKAVELVKHRKTILFMGPQPAMLAIKSGKAQLRLKDIPQDLAKEYTMVYTRSEDSNELEHQLGRAGIHYKVIYSFKTLSSRTTWIKFARSGATKQDWLESLKTRSLEPIQSTIMLYQLIR